MKSIALLFTASGTLADSVLALATAINGTTAKLQRQLKHENEPAND
jgi:hypothetical protein